MADLYFKTYENEEWKPFCMVKDSDLQLDESLSYTEDIKFDLKPDDTYSMEFKMDMSMFTKQQYRRLIDILCGYKRNNWCKMHGQNKRRYHGKRAKGVRIR